MQAMVESSCLLDSPSFNSYSTNRLAEIAAKVTEEFILDDDDDEDCELEIEEGYEAEDEERRAGTEEEEEEIELPELSRSLNDQPPSPLKEQQLAEENNEIGDDFEFPVFGKDPDDLSPKPADEIFYNGQIRPVFPFFNRKLLIADGRDFDSKIPKNRSSRRPPLGKLLIEEHGNDDPPSSSSSETDELESVPDGTYCVWSPKPVQQPPETCKKSNSTGFSKRTWKFRDLLYRSNSEGMDAYVFLSPSKSVSKRNDRTEKTTHRIEIDKSSPRHHHHHHHHQQQQQQRQTPPKEKSNSVPGQASKGKKKSKPGSTEALSAHEIHYVRYRALKEEDRRRSYLPYRQDLVGLFSNPNGATSRNLHPF